MGQKGKAAPVKRMMNLYFKTDRTVKPATIMLYVLFVLVVLLGLSKILVYDIWMERENARMEALEAQNSLNAVLAELKDYNNIKLKYQRYSATEEERAQTNRMEVVSLLDTAVGTMARISDYSINGTEISMQIDNITLAQVARMVQRLEESPLVAGTSVSTAASTTGNEDLVSAAVQIHLQEKEEDAE